MNSIDPCEVPSSAWTEELTAQLRPVLIAVPILVVTAVLLVNSPTRAVSVGLAIPLLVAVALVPVSIVKRVLVALVVLELAIPIDLIIGFDPTLSATSTISGLNLSLGAFALTALYVFWGLEGVAARWVRPGLGRSLILVASAYPAAVALSFLVARDASLWLSEAVIVLQGFLLLMYVLYNMKTRADIYFVFVFLTLGLLVQGLYVTGAAGPLSGLEYGPFSQHDSSNRSDGTFGSPNVLGAYLTMILPLSLGLSASRAPRALRLVAAAAFAFGLVALALTYSRGAWLGALLTMPLLLIGLLRRGWLPRTALAALGGSVLFAFAVFGSAISTRISSAGSSTADVRLTLMDMAWRMIGDHPLLGVGANNFIRALPGYLTPEFSDAWLSTVHNKYLLVWSETGILGLAAWLLLLGAGLRSGWLAWRTNDRDMAPLGAALAAGLAAGMVHSFGELYHNRIQVQLIMLLCALLFIARRAVIPVQEQVSV